MQKQTKSVLAMVVSIMAIFSPIQMVNAATVQSTITRSQVKQRAMNMINLTWTYDASKNSNIAAVNVANVTQPKQLNNQTVATEIGIPYNWGGMDGLDAASSNAPWTSFIDAISKGAYAGNINSKAGLGYITGTAGVDCSGFVQNAYNIKDYKLSTSSMFNKYFVKINMTDLKHMDILNHPGDHVVLFDKWGSLNGRSGAFTYEATPDQTFGGIMGAKQYFISMDEINGGYLPGRYINIIEDAVAPTPTPVIAPSPSPVPTPTPVINPVTQVFSAGTIVQVMNVSISANFRASGDTNSAIIDTIPKNTILSILGNSNGWYNVNYNGKNGWVYGNLIGAAPAGKYVTTNGVYQLNIRNSASGTAYIVGVITEGKYALVLGTSYDGYWTNIRLNGIDGWSASKYLK